MTKVLLITGDHPRHLHAVASIASFHEIVGWIIEEREPLLPKFSISDLNVDTELKEFWDRHFHARYTSEYRFFVDEFSEFDLVSKKSRDLMSPRILRVSQDSLNSSSTISFVSNTDADIAISYGCHVLQKKILDEMPLEKYNIHAGISPWYRGCITHFWPSYFLEPQMTGMTLHRLTDVLDGGQILHQNSASLVRGDGLHDLACRTVRSFQEELPSLISRIETGDYHLEEQKSSGKLWMASDWNPHHLRLVYGFFEDKIVDYCIDSGKVALPKKIKRVSQS